jgi:hypothetical protein
MNYSNAVLKQNDDNWSEKIERLATRLGIEPIIGTNSSPGQMRMVLSTRNGFHQYDLLDLIHAFLDKLDQAESSKQET